MNTHSRLDTAFDAVSMVQEFDKNIKSQRFTIVSRGLESISNCRTCPGKSTSTYSELKRLEIELAGKEACSVLFIGEYETSWDVVTDSWAAFREALIRHLISYSPCPAHMAAARLVDVMSARHAGVRHALRDFILSCQANFNYIANLLEGDDMEEAQFVASKLKAKVAGKLPLILDPDTACTPQAS